MIQNTQSPASGEANSQDDYLPARMVNEFVYCPRLFFLEYVEGQFAHNSDTVDGAIKHRRVDATVKALPKRNSAAAPSGPPADGAQPRSIGEEGQNAEPEDVLVTTDSETPTLHARSVTLASDRHRVLAKLDLVEATGVKATPVDYKRGRPKIGDDGLPTVWEPEQV